ncbi:MAG: ATP-binding protein [Pseudomonadota bacterium]
MPVVDYAIQPYQGTDVVAFVLAIVAVLCLALWRRDGEAGMGWFALAMALLSLWMATNRYHLPVDRFLLVSNLSHVLLLGVACLALGLLAYLDVPPDLRRRALWFTLLPVAVYSGLIILTGLGLVRVPRVWANLMVGVCFAAMGTLAIWASRREPGAGHAIVGAVLWSIPMLAVVMAVAEVDSVALRYWGVLPVLVLSLTLLTVSLLRRRRALETEVSRRRAAEDELTVLNASLEAAVSQRTADLQSMVAGLESFNRSVSHDLRGSLGGISGAARLADEALQRGNDAMARRVLPLIANQAESSARLVSALLSLARVGDAALRRQPLDLRPLVQQVVDQLTLERGALAMPSVVIHALPTVDADPDLLTPALANLIGNAVKFSSGTQGARVDIGGSSTATEALLYVRDNGVGFSADAADGLFMPFVRLHGQAFDGHGVGLSIVRRAVERHGGRVWAESQPGQGATFHIGLPNRPPG